MRSSTNARLGRGMIVALGLALCATSAPAAAQIRTETISFPRGKTSTTLIGTLKGDLTRDYVVTGQAGQTLTVTLNTSNGSAYFNVLPPGSADEAIFIGSTSGNSFRGTLSETGRHTVRVYLMRNAARENQSALYTLKVGLSVGSGSAGGGAAGKAPISDLAGMNSIRAIDVMAERGFKDADSTTSGDTQYGIFWRPSSRQCVQLTLADGKVVSADDIGTHPKCR